MINIQNEHFQNHETILNQISQFWISNLYIKSAAQQMFTHSRHKVLPNPTLGWAATHASSLAHPFPQKLNKHCALSQACKIVQFILP